MEVAGLAIWGGAQRRTKLTDEQVPLPLSTLAPALPLNLGTIGPYIDIGPNPYGNIGTTPYHHQNHRPFRYPFDDHINSNSIENPSRKTFINVFFHTFVCISTEEYGDESLMV